MLGYRVYKVNTTPRKVWMFYDSYQQWLALMNFVKSGGTTAFILGNNKGGYEYYIVDEDYAFRDLCSKRFYNSHRLDKGYRWIQLMDILPIRINSSPIGTKPVDLTPYAFYEGVWDIFKLKNSIENCSYDRNQFGLIIEDSDEKHIKCSVPSLRIDLGNTYDYDFLSVQLESINSAMWNSRSKYVVQYIIDNNMFRVLVYEKRTGD